MHVLASHGLFPIKRFPIKRQERNLCTPPLPNPLPCSRKDGFCYTSLSWLQFLVTLWRSDTHNVLCSAALLSSYRLVPMVFIMEPTNLLLGLPLFLLPLAFSWGAWRKSSSGLPLPCAAQCVGLNYVCLGCWYHYQMPKRYYVPMQEVSFQRQELHRDLTCPEKRQTLGGNVS